MCNEGSAAPEAHGRDQEDGHGPPRTQGRPQLSQPAARGEPAEEERDGPEDAMGENLQRRMLFPEAVE